VTDRIVHSSDEGQNSTSLGLLERVRAKDPAAWERFVELYSPLVAYWCRQSGLQDADMADVRQEVFLAVNRKVAVFRRQSKTGAFRAWLRVITRNKICDHGRRRVEEPRGQGSSDWQARLLEAPQPESDDCAADASHAEERLLYRRALDILRQDFEERTWQAFWKVVIDEQAPTEVAQSLAISVNTVYLAKSRVLARLREEFAGFIEV
jgi:RNA polymerase sigma-70 factor (ECF subfamily)